MNLKKLIKKVAVQEAAKQILPMDETPKKLGTKTKVAAGLAVVATVAGALSQYLGG
jgi:hypothetical protein